MGANSSTTEKDADHLFSNNYLYTKELAQYSLEKNIRFIYASSAATYGDGSLGFDDDDNKLETLRPLNMYGYSKQLFDLWAKKNDAFDKIVGLKYFNVYGPNEYHKGDMRSVVHKAFEQIRDTGKVKLFKSLNPKYKDGEQLRDFIYIKDAVDMTLFFLDKPNVNGLFNLGTGKARTWNDLVTAIFKSLNKPVNIEYIDLPEHLRDKYQYFTEAKMDKIKKAGFNSPITSLEDGVADYVKNYLLGKQYLGSLVSNETNLRPLRIDHLRHQENHPQLNHLLRVLRRMDFLLPLLLHKNHLLHHQHHPRLHLFSFASQH